MSISAPKCAAFRIIPTKDSWYLADPGMALQNGEALPVATVETQLTYLGARISPWAGMAIHKNNTQSFPSCCETAPEGRTDHHIPSPTLPL
jgi:hypothetical protein